MNDDQLSTTTAPVGPEDSNRLDRRNAMKAALGGAAAGAVFVAPKVAGFSIARIIACFLALLELAKQKMIKLRQDEWLGDIHYSAAEVEGQMQLHFDGQGAEAKPAPETEDTAKAGET